MQDVDATIAAALGNEPPLDGDGRSGPPDRREVSARWLSGTFLTGVTSSVLMGVALFAALDGREQLATPPEVATLSPTGSPSEQSGEAAKRNRIAPPRAITRQSDRQRMEVSTLTRQGDSDVVRMVPFMHLAMSLADRPANAKSYPKFDPLEVFAEDASVQTANTGLIYGAKVESEVTLKTSDFPLETATFDEKSELSADEVEDVVRTTGVILPDGGVQVASLHYIAEERFGDAVDAQTLSTYGVRIVPENMSVSPRAGSDVTKDYAEEVLPIKTDQPFETAFAGSGYEGDESRRMAEALSTLTGQDVLKAGSVLRIGLQVVGDRGTILRCSLYEKGDHVLTVALNDRGQFVQGDAPEPSPLVASAFGENLPQPVRGDLPTIYDAVNRSALSYGLSRSMTKQLVKLLASDVDYQAAIAPKDRLEVFFSQPDEDNNSTDESELLYVSARFGDMKRVYYRFQMDDGSIDYFDQDGKSSRQFLLRNPVPNGRFTSGFGGRKHPILGYVRMHSGVDWAAPRGTPIIAAGNGVVESAERSSSFGNQTIIRHANGYETSYNHQNAFAPGVVKGAKVRQGQVIGYVGTTGLSTGPHLHYELIVNGTKVDPMRVRLPDSRALKGEELAEFKKERDRIDAFLADEAQKGLTLASREVSIN
ncbi:M23 family metallopeptidase [Tianweitania sp. BSSL-BM11]|uniref:M23 family metallopeptidase n=1 Tax=Tianweitania aestuarii TaxID=2814886 RepID=A0ABS5S1S4_9HYPH|nr:M23 family metallopeptidase [Tianweitania aestuarii]MBS9722429.1 M23 family metallopeptidase [Tianweitania aestuarii]